MKKAIFTALSLSVLANMAAAANPYAHLDEWYDICDHGGAYIHFDISEETEETKFYRGTSSDGTPVYTTNTQIKVKVDEATTQYVPTDGDIKNKTHNKYDKIDARAQCHDNLKDIAYAVEAAVNSTGNEWLKYDNISGWPHMGIKTIIKQYIDDFQKDIRWSSSPHVLNNFDNGAFEDDDVAHVFDGRILTNLPTWLRADPHWYE